jgi:hypothetical protein
MPRRNMAGLLVAFGCLSAGSGCALVFEQNEQIRAQEPRNCVRFESATAADLFHSAYAERLNHRDPARSSSFGIIFVTWVSCTTTVAEAAFYNDEVAACDTNRDGLISEAEANAYHDRAFPQGCQRPGVRFVTPEPPRFGTPLPAEPIPAVPGQSSP